MGSGPAGESRASWPLPARAWQGDLAAILAAPLHGSTESCMHRLESPLKLHAPFRSPPLLQSADVNLLGTQLTFGCTLDPASIPAGATLSYRVDRLPYGGEATLSFLCTTTLGQGQSGRERLPGPACLRCACCARCALPPSRAAAPPPPTPSKHAAGRPPPPCCRPGPAALSMPSNAQHGALAVGPGPLASMPRHAAAQRAHFACKA